jgi:hypothetical protein
MKRITIEVDDSDEVKFKMDGVDIVHGMLLLNGALNQILHQLKQRKSGIIKPDPAAINQALGK